MLWAMRNLQNILCLKNKRINLKKERKRHIWHQINLLLNQKQTKLGKVQREREREHEQVNQKYKRQTICHSNG